MKRILSRDNPLFRHLSRLADSPRYRREHGTLVLDGEHLIDAYFAAFAQSAGSTLVTFDRGFRLFPTIQVDVLP